MQRLLQAVEQTNDIIFMTDRDGKIKYVNPAFSKIYGYSPEEVYDRTPRMLKSGMSNGASYTAFWEKILARQNIRAEWTNRTKDGRLVTVDSTVSPVLGGHGGLSGFVAVQRDVTLEHQNQKDRKVLENQLYEAQKLESIGTLAGGIAHDFNNVLAIVLGYIALLKNAPGDVQNVENVTEAVSTAVQRGADLVRQILVFARKTEVSFAPLEVNLLVTEVQKMVQETFPRTIAVKAELDTNILLIDADRTQVYQTLLNLCVNARDAMPKGGTISIATRKVAGYQLRDRFPGAEETDFVNVSVADTGVGMNQATRKRVFEPFFTTKGKEKGTGLGLSVVYGIMKSHQGYVDVQSVMGQGTTFDLFFPVRHEVPPAKATGTEEEHTPVGGTESILVVEDEALLRDLLKTILAANGYNVFIASDGEEAVSVYKNHHKEIALVIADLGLPKLDGTGVFDHLRMINPGVKVLIASGYIDPGVKSGLLKAGAMGFLQKPMRPDETVRRVREALDRD